MVNGEKKRMEKDSEVYGGNKTRKYSKRHIKYRKKKSSKMKRTKKNLFWGIWVKLSFLGILG